MIENMSIRNCCNSSYRYLLKVYTRDKINDLFCKTFYSIWKESIFLRKRRVEIVNSEIRIFLRKNDIIQKYIDHVSKVISRTDNYVKHQKKKSIHKKRVILVKPNSERYYLLQQKVKIS